MTMTYACPRGCETGGFAPATAYLAIVNFAKGAGQVRTGREQNPAGVAVQHP